MSGVMNDRLEVSLADEATRSHIQMTATPELFPFLEATDYPHLVWNEEHSYLCLGL